MPALTQPYETHEREGLIVAYPVKANARIWKGALVCIDSTGYLVPASDTANLRFVGVAFESVDNTGGANGAKRCRVVKRGTFIYNRTGADLRRRTSAQPCAPSPTTRSPKPARTISSWAQWWNCWTAIACASVSTTIPCRR